MSDPTAAAEPMADMDAADVKRLAGKRRFARGRARRRPGTMNKTEAAYATELDLMHKGSHIEWWAFEPIKLRLADKTFYTPDFAVMHPDGLIEFVEVKGHWEDDARVKIKVAAAQFPMFKFTAVKPVAKKHGGGWKREEF